MKKTVNTYLKENKSEKDILIYEYLNPAEYLAHYNTTTKNYEFYDPHTSKRITHDSLIKRINKAYVLCEYIYAELIALQVKF